ncbi:hypothetical protein ACOMHN_055630 [Nucella lapillus]
MVDVQKVSVFLVLALSLSNALSLTRFHSPYNPKIHNALPNEYRYQTLYMTQKVDHFGFHDGQTFQQRYLVANQFWNDNNGPIFFYTGNEGDITWFCNNTGFMWDIAPEFKALLIFAEHRYYGQSLPFGSQSFKNSSMLNYLTAEQALADFAELIRFTKQTVPGARNSPVIAFGGSYGGMLAAWMRLRYPNVVTGSLAASAPVWMFPGLSQCGSFFSTVQRTFQTGGSQCVENVGRSWSTITSMSSAEGLNFISRAFSLCKPLKGKRDAQALIDWLVNVYGNLAMVDYPYPASFLEPLPAWPVKEFCMFLKKPFQGKELLQQLAQGVKMYFNYTGQAPCLNISQQASGNLGDSGWSYQACTEMVNPMCSENSTMFFDMPWDFKAYAAGCRAAWGVMPRENWMSLSFWGKNISSASNIIFSNGLLDPWSGYGVLQSLAPSLVALQIPQGAHHLDLRAKNPRDPPGVTAAREREEHHEDLAVWQRAGALSGFFLNR